MSIKSANEWNKRNKELVRQRRVAYDAKVYNDRRKSKPLYGVVMQAKTRCKKRNLDFDLVWNEIPIPEFCPYLGIKLNFQNSSVKPDSPSLDRKDASKGYTMDNIQVISQLANAMKSNATEEQLITFAENVLRIHKGK